MKQKNYFRLLDALRVLFFVALIATPVCLGLGYPYLALGLSFCAATVCSGIITGKWIFGLSIEETLGMSIIFFVIVDIVIFLIVLAILAIGYFVSLLIGANASLGETWVRTPCEVCCVIMFIYCLIFLTAVCKDKPQYRH